MKRTVLIPLCFSLAAACCSRPHTLKLSEKNPGEFLVQGGNIYRVSCTGDAYLSFDGKPATKDSVKIQKNVSQMFSIVKDQKIFAASIVPAECTFQKE